MNQYTRRSARGKNTSAPSRMSAKANISALPGLTSQSPFPKPTSGYNITHTTTPLLSMQTLAEILYTSRGTTSVGSSSTTEAPQMSSLGNALSRWASQKKPTQVLVPTHRLRGEANRSPRQNRAECDIRRSKFIEDGGNNLRCGRHQLLVQRHLRPQHHHQVHGSHP